MVAINFQPRFEQAIREGRKKRTIRRRRRRDFHPGDGLQLYVGLRTKQARLIANAICTRVVGVDFDIAPSGAFWRYSDDTVAVPDHDYHPINDAFAIADGFADAREMVGFFRRYALPHEIRSDGAQLFSGNIVEWDLAE